MSRRLQRTLGLAASLAAAATTLAGGAAATIAPLKRFPIPRDPGRAPVQPVAPPEPPPATVAPAEPPRLTPPTPPRRRWR